MPMVIASVAGSIGAFLTQVTTMLIAHGLEGDFSAITLMWVQAVVEIVKRLHAAVLIMIPVLSKRFCSKLGNCSLQRSI